MSPLMEKLVGLPFGTAAVEELLQSGVIERNAIYRRREIVEALRRRFIELGGDADTSPQQVIVPLKRVLDGPLFARIRPGFYRYLGHDVDDSGSLMVRDAEPASGEASPGRDGRRSWRNQLDRASTAEAIESTLRLHGRERVADRIHYLQELAREYPEEEPMDFDSLWHMARFLLEHGQLPDPEVGVSPNATAQIEWTIPNTSDDRAGNGLLAMEFLPRAMVGFAALSEPYREGVDRLTVYGKMPAADALGAVRAFTDRIQRT